MPNIKSAAKRMRQAQRQRTHNRARRSALRTAIKRVRTAGGAEDAARAFREAQRLLDRAARHGLIAKGTAARHKQRLAKVVAAKS